jgi:hypothetical protein
MLNTYVSNQEKRESQDLKQKLKLLMQHSNKLEICKLENANREIEISESDLNYTKKAISKHPQK